MSCDSTDNLNLCKNNNNITRERFWLSNITDLYRDNKYLNFVPTINMTREQQMNSIIRFFIYTFILMLVFKKSEKWLMIPVIGIIFVSVLYYIFASDPETKKKEFDRIVDLRTEQQNLIKQHLKKEIEHDDIDKRYDITDDNGYNVDHQIGVYDSNGQIYFPNQNSDKKTYDGIFTVDELEDYRQNTCRRPTTDNPFMNPNIYDYNTPHVPVACNEDDENINEEIKTSFNYDLFRDLDDLYEVKNSQRQFYTIPNTSIPNQQMEFANFLYKIPNTCKEDKYNCVSYEDLRFKR